MPPFLQAERRIGDDDIEVLERVFAIEKLGVADRVAPLDAVVVLAMQEHVHLGERPGAADGFLTVERVFA